MVSLAANHGIHEAGKVWLTSILGHFPACLRRYRVSSLSNF